jgi:RNA polymerase sigma-70 factor, ECF subfamily
MSRMHDRNCDKPDLVNGRDASDTVNPIEPESDEQLIALARNGSESAFGKLVDRHTPALFRMAYVITRSAADAEDVVQETFLRAYKHIDDFSPEKAAFKTWLFTIGRNQSINLFSSLKRKASRLLNDFDSDNVDQKSLFQPVMSAEDLLINRQDKQLLQNALNKLPERQRTAMVLKVQEDFSYEQIAEIMSVSASSVESLLFRARKKLVEILGDNR